MIVPTFDRPEELRATLRALVDQEATARFEVVVADDGSSVNTIGVLREFEEVLEVFYGRQADRGFRLAAARNLGARLARGATLIFLDSGTLAAPGLVTAHLQNVRPGERANSGPTYGWDFSGPEAHAFRALVDGENWAEAHLKMSHLDGHQDYRIRKWLDVQERRVPMALPWRFFWGRNIAVSADDFDVIGGFDETLVSYGVEDIEFGYRLDKAGIEPGWAEHAWAVEMPSVKEDAAMQAEQNRANLLSWADSTIDSEVEFYVCNRPLSQLEQPEWERVQSWARTATNSRADLERLSQTGMSSLFVGLMSPVAHPEDVCAIGPNMPLGTLPWKQAIASNGGSAVNLNSLGIRLGFADNTFETAYLADSLAGLREIWGMNLEREAKRVAREVEYGPAFYDDWPTE